MAGVFPFMESGDVTDREEEVVIADLPLTVFAGSQFASTSGEQAEATAHAQATPESIAALVDSANLRVTVAGTTYGIVDCIHHQFADYLELGLQRNKPL